MNSPGQLEIPNLTPVTLYDVRAERQRQGNFVSVRVGPLNTDRQVPDYLEASPDHYFDGLDGPLLPVNGMQRVWLWEGYDRYSSGVHSMQGNEPRPKRSSLRVHGFVFDQSATDEQLASYGAKLDTLPVREALRGGGGPAAQCMIIGSAVVPRLCEALESGERSPYSLRNMTRGLLTAVHNTAFSADTASAR